MIFSRTENGAFVCNECELKFAEDEALKQHMLQVHSDKPYKCDRCQAAFRYKGNLASHKTVHTGDTCNTHINNLMSSMLFTGVQVCAFAVVKS